jgi:hypothetical protein
MIQQKVSITLNVDESTVARLDIIRAEYVEAYKIHLRFSDGKNQIVDFEPFLKNARNPAAAKYRNIEKFRQFRLDYGNLQWNDYEMCFATEDLYNNDIEVEISNEDRQKLEEMARQLGCYE